ncbi:MAG TPA: biotin--[acetyl-CoA-carboxylase] ligase [Candidatus Binataceae bacterium]|nr:biotin--[acetyl-CoA-carboxylase] ligase [Candidatus Binataceae bacterium]
MPSNPYHTIEAGNPGRIGWRIHYFEEVDSTQRTAAEMAENGAAHGTVVVAERQSAGRGRLGRSWHSPAGVNLYTTIILRPAMPVAEVPRLSLVAGVAAAESLEPVAPGIVALKWPNDIWLNGRKAGGIIAEASTDSADGLICVLLGIGLNLNLAADDLSPELRDKATSVLIATGRQCDRVQIAAALFNRLNTRYMEAQVGGFAAIRPAYERYFALNGRSVTIIDRGSRLAGVVRGIDHDGALMLETAAGVSRILTGDVSVEGAYD